MTLRINNTRIKVSRKHGLGTMTDSGIKNLLDGKMNLGSKSDCGRGKLFQNEIAMKIWELMCNSIPSHSKDMDQVISEAVEKCPGLTYA